MFSLNAELTANSIILIAIFQLLIVTFTGWIFGTFLRYFYTHLSASYKVFNPKNYTPSVNGYPKRYRFVVVKYRTSGELQSETFYRLLGDWTRIEYINGKYHSISTLAFSNILLLLFPLIGILLLIIASPQEFASNTQILESYGEVFFIPTLISGTVKLLFDLIYVKLYQY